MNWFNLIIRGRRVTLLGRGIEEEMKRGVTGFKWALVWLDEPLISRADIGGRPRIVSPSKSNLKLAWNWELKPSLLHI